MQEEYEKEKREDMEDWEDYLLTGEAIPHDIVAEWLNDLSRGKFKPCPNIQRRLAGCLSTPPKMK